MIWLFARVQVEYVAPLNWHPFNRSPDVIETLAGLMTRRGVREHIRSDNARSLTARTVREWLGERDSTAWIALREPVKLLVI